MKNSKVVLILFIVFFFIACSSSSKTKSELSLKNDEGYDAEIIYDMAERKVSVKKNPSRVLCIGPGALRLFAYMGLEDKIVGVEALEKRYPRGRPYWIAKEDVLKELPIIGPGGPSSINNIPNPEAILKVRPDVIFATYLDKGNADKVQNKINIPIVVLNYGKFATFDPAVYGSLKLIGNIFNKGKRAKEIINFIEAKRADLSRRVIGIKDKPPVYIAGLGFKGSQGIESSDASYVPFNWLNANNVAGRIENQGGHLFVGREQLLKLNPGIIFIDGGGFKLIKQDYLKKPNYYNALSAFKNNRVYKLFPFNWYVTNIGTAIVDSYAVGKIIYPERFKDVDIKKISNDIYENLLGVPLYDEMAKDYGELGSKVNFPM